MAGERSNGISADVRGYMLFDLNPDAVFCVDPAGEIIDVNPAAVQLSGRPREEIIGAHFLDFFPPDQTEVPLESFQKLSAGEATLNVTVTVERPDGSHVVLDVNSFPSMDGDRFVGICGIARDVTERVAEREQLRRSEQALRESEGLVRQITENIDQIFYLSSRESQQVLYVSPQFEKLWDMSMEEVIANPKGFLDRIHPEDRPRVQRTAFKALDFDMEYRLLRPDGSIRWVHDKGFPVRNEDGKVTRVAGIVEDVTDRKVLEEQLRQAQKMESVGQLAGGVAHDFNNLLLVIQNSVRFIEEGLVSDDPAREDLTLIAGAAERGASLVRQLLAFSRKQIIDPKVLNVNDVIEETENLLRRAVGERIEILLKLDPRLELTQIDPNQLGHVLMNLVVNSRDAMPQGGTFSIETSNVVLTEEMEEGFDPLPAGRYVCISVSDTGHGIERDVVPKIFEPFFSTKSKAEATGLGLSMVYGIVSQAGGRISVHSEPRIGSTFKVYLPAAEGSVDVEPPPTTSRPTAPSGRVVLLAEDDPDVSTAVARILDRAGFKVLHAYTGDAALAMCRSYEGRIDLLLADVVMPGMSGRELGVHVNALRPGTKIVYMSGYSDDMIGRHGILQADENYLQKPFTSADLIDKIEAALAES